MQFIRQKPSKQSRLATACLLALAIVGTLPWRTVAKSPETTTQPQPKTPEAGSDHAPVPPAAEKSSDRGTVSGLRSVAELPFRRDDILRVFPLKQARAEEIVKCLQAFQLGQDANGQKLIVVADPRTNAVIVQAPPNEMTQVAELIQTLDAQTIPDARVGESRMEGSDSDPPLRIVSPKPGYVQKLFVTSGSSVKRGDPLVQLEDHEIAGAPGQPLMLIGR